MRTLGNILWHVPFLGFITASLFWLTGGLFTITVIGAPIGLGLMEYGKFLFWPFGKEMVSKKDLNIEQNSAWATYALIVRILYFPIGLIYAIIAIFQIIGLFITILGIPMAIIVAKSISTVFNPVNKKCVSSAVADELDRRRGIQELEAIQK